MVYNKFALLILLIASLVAGCQSPPLYTQTQDNAADVSQKIKDSIRMSNETAKTAPPLVVNQGLYVDRTPISLTREPGWLKNNILIRGEQLPFSYYSRVVADGVGKILIHYQAGVNPISLMSVNYSGSVKGALDLLAAKTGYVYSIRGKHIYWQAFVSKTFEIAFMPGTASYVMGDTGGGGAASLAGGSTAGGLTAGAGQTSSLKGDISVWQDLENTIKQLMSTDGKVIVSQATTSVTVRDRPANIALIAKFIQNFNKNLSRQVLVKIEILQVTLNSAFNFGINWGIIQNAFGGSDFALTANYGTPITIKSLSSATIPTFGLKPDNEFAQGLRETTFQVLVNALKQQGAVAVVSEPRVVCLNNQVSVINLVDKQGFAQSVSSTALAGGAGSGSSVTSSISPGTVVTGLVLYILPKIMESDKVYLQVNADLSNLISIDNFTSSGATGGSSPASIQVPHTAEKEFNQRALIKSGDTLILSGFRQVANQTGAVQLLDSQALGGKGASQANAETIVLITPIVLHGSA